MAIITEFLGEAMNAQMYMVLDNVQLKLKQVKLDATNAVGAVTVTVYAADGVTEIYQRTFQPGENVTQNIPGNLDYTIESITDRNGIQHFRLTSPPWKIEGV